MKKFKLINYIFLIFTMFCLASCSSVNDLQSKLGISIYPFNAAQGSADAVQQERVFSAETSAEESVPQMKQLSSTALNGVVDEYKADSAVNSITYADISSSGSIADFGMNNISPSMTSNRKLIRTVFIDSETTNFDKAYNFITDSISSFDGYIENYDVDGKRISRPDVLRRANFTLRLPRDKADEYIKSLETRLNFIHKNENLRDITLEYADTETRKDTLETERKTLQALLKKATKVSDTIQIEQRISEITSELENIERRLKRYDNNIDFTTIYLNIAEVKTITVDQDNPTAISIKEGFEQNLIAVKNFFIYFGVWIITHLPAISVVALFILLISLIGFSRRMRKRRRRHNIEDELN